MTDNLRIDFFQDNIGKSIKIPNVVGARGDLSCVLGVILLNKYLTIKLN